MNEDRWYAEKVYLSGGPFDGDCVTLQDPVDWVLMGSGEKGLHRYLRKENESVFYWGGEGLTNEQKRKAIGYSSSQRDSAGI